METENTKSAGTEPEIIKGVIEYELTLEKDGMSIKYTSSIQNDLAINSMMSVITQTAKDRLKEHFKTNKGDKYLAYVLNQSAHGLAWLKTNWQSLYELYKRKEIKEEANLSSYPAETKVTIQDEVKES